MQLCFKKGSLSTKPKYHIMKKYALLILAAFTTFLVQAQYHLDSTFNGTATNEFLQYPGNVVNGKQVAYTADNNLIVAGRWNTNLVVWKYKQDGELDLSFGTNGMSYFDLSVYNTDIWVIVHDLEIQANGKIVVLADKFLFSSSNFDYSQSSIVVARFNADGSPDLSFNGTGILNTKPESNFNYHPICLDVDDATGQVYVGGTVTEYGAYGCPFGTGAWFVTNFTDNGTYDLTFNNSGYIQGVADDFAQGLFAAQTPMSLVYDVKALPNNCLFFAGTLNNIDNAMYTARLNADGTYDYTYAVTGRKALQDLTNYHFPSNGYTTVTILEDQSTLFHVNAPSITNEDSVNSVIYKFNSLGNPDLTFGINGVRKFDELASTTRVILDTNDRIIYAWYNYPSSTEQHINFRRLMPDGSDDASFGFQGHYEHLPVANENITGYSYLEDMYINPENDDLTIIAMRTASYAPNCTFRILNYRVDSINDNLSLQTILDNENTLLYPNPTEGQVTIEIPVSAKFSLIQSNGSLVQSGNMEAGQNSFDWSDKVNSGLYFLQIQTKTGESLILKISVEN